MLNPIWYCIIGYVVAVVVAALVVYAACVMSKGAPAPVEQMCDAAPGCAELGCMERNGAGLGILSSEDGFGDSRAVLRSRNKPG